MAPWPDNYFLSTTYSLALSSTTPPPPTAFPSLLLTNASLPIPRLGGALKASPYRALQGFSPLGPIFTQVQGLDLSRTPTAPRPWDVAASLSPASASLLLDTETMTAVPHFIEEDRSVGASVTASASAPVTLQMWPAVQLVPGRRYVVALRNLTDANGALLPIAPLVAALFSSRIVPPPLLIPQQVWLANRVRYRRMRMDLASFGSGWAPPNADAGAAPGIVQAWDFTVNTDANMTGELVSMQNDALAAVGGGAGMNWTVDSVLEAPSAGAGRVVRGTFSAPLYLSSALPGPNVRLVRDPATGLPVRQGFIPVPFIALIPASLLGSSPPAIVPRLLVFGHGLFGNRTSLLDPALVSAANRFNFVAASVDWWGLSDADLATAATIFSLRLSDIPAIPDRLAQGVLNSLLLPRLFTVRGQGTISASRAFAGPGGAYVLTPASTGAVLPALQQQVRSSYFGISLGGILGVSRQSLSSTEDRGVLQVPGAPSSLLLQRSVLFAPFLAALRLQFPRPVDVVSVLALVQLLACRVDPSGYLNHLRPASFGGTPFPNTPQHATLVQYAIADESVSFMGAEILGRSLAAVTFAETLRNNDTRVPLRFRGPLVLDLLAAGSVPPEKLFGMRVAPAGEPLLSLQGTNGTALAGITGFAFAGATQQTWSSVPPAGATFSIHSSLRETAWAQEQAAALLVNGTFLNPCVGQGLCLLPRPAADGSAAGLPAIGASAMEASVEDIEAAVRVATGK
jgi:hypothetical protein